MAYYLHHTLLFNNVITENITVEMYRKDVVPDSVIPLKCDYLKKQYLSGNGDKFDCIISSELTIGLFLRVGDTVTFADFLVSFHDEWKVIVKNDGQIDYVGFLVPNECQAQMKDKPYELELIATDGLGFLKSIAISDINAINFVDYNTIGSYIFGALIKTQLDLNVRIYSNIYESSMINRITDINKDFFTQGKLNYRSFQKNDSTFKDCYNVLADILTEGFNLFQWFGKWVIMRLGEFQGTIGPKIYYTEYDKTGIVVNSALETTGAAQIAKNRILHAINASARILAKFAIKSAKHTFNYTVWPELPKNNKFERGTLLIGVGGPDQRAYLPDDWIQGTVNLFDLPNPTQTPISNKFYRLSTYDAFGVETERVVAADSYNQPDGNHQFWMRSEAMPVNAGDKIKFGCQKKFDSNFGSGSNSVFTSPATVYIVNTAGTIAYYLDNNVDGHATNNGIWKQAVNLGGQLLIEYFPGQSTTDWASCSVDSTSFPVSGNLYIAFKADGPIGNTGPRQYFKDFTLEYFPFIAGGYIPVKGDYWFTQQTPDYKDIIEVDVNLSDGPVKVLQGAIFRNNGVDLTTRSWYRLNVNETRAYKELINIARYNGAYRRTWQVSGLFGGTMFHPSDDETVRIPLGFHRHFYFANSPELAGYYFQLVPPLTIDYGRGEIDAIFVDCFKNGSNDGNDEGNIHEFKYKF